ncbi:MAG: ABC transporter permease [Gemmataceae bacterium]
MNEKVKLGTAVGGGLAVAGGVWYAADLPLSAPSQFVWFVLAAVSLGLLAYTFEVSKRNLQRLAGVVLLLAGLITALGLSNENAFGRSNVLSKLNQHGEYGIVCVGAGLLILTGGIDLSIGSVVGLSAVGFGVLMEKGVPPVLALLLVLLAGVLIGLLHGLLVTQQRVQAFLVTLCGMFVYRGLARTICAGSTGMETVSLKHEEFREPLRHLRLWLTGIGLDERLSFPAQFVVMLVLAAAVAVFLHRSAFGRYWYAIGYNEQAARYAGVTVWRHKVAVFCVCSALAALAGVVRFLSAGSVAPSSEGQSYELYAITAAVLGGVSLRGGEGTAVGMVLGALVLPVVNTLMNFTECPPAWEPWIIGLILLFGTVADEFIRRRSKVNR